MNKDRFAIRCFGAVGNKAQVEKRFFTFRRQRQVIHPLEEIGARLIAHPRGQAAGETVALEKSAEILPQEIFRVKRQRPIKAVTHKNQAKIAECDWRSKLQIVASKRKRISSGIRIRIKIKIRIRSNYPKR